MRSDRKSGAPGLPDTPRYLILRWLRHQSQPRAARQRLIVRQSCLSNAVETLKVDKKGVDPTEALKLAERYVGWVFGEEASVSSIAPDFSDMDDDIPM